MTTGIVSPLVDDLLELAGILADTRKRNSLDQVAFRRSVSTAYYALFHALCYLCADELVGWSKTDELEPIYRSLDHGRARKVRLIHDANPDWRDLWDDICA